MAPWLRFLEAYLVQMLLRTPAFHRGVEKVARQVHKMRHGTPPEEMGGTKIDRSGNHSFVKDFYEEVQTQLGRAEGKSGGDTAVKTTRAENSAGAQGVKEKVEDQGADAVWESTKKTSSEAPKQGFMGEYIGALREQIRSGK